MNIIVFAVINLVLLIGAPVFLMETQQSSFAQTVLSTVSTEPGQFSELPHSDHPQAAYQSGFNWGIHDAWVTCKPDCRNVYIWQPGKTFYFHTKEFIRGYMTRWCSVNGPQNGMDENEASFDCITTIKDPDLADWYICEGNPQIDNIEALSNLINGDKF